MKLILASLLLASPAQAQTIDPLWEKTVAQANAARKWVAQDTEFVVNARVKGEDKVIRTRSHLAGWDGSKPHYDTTVIEPRPEAGKTPPDANMGSEGFALMADGLIKLDAPVKRQDGQVLDGKTWTVFRLAESQAVLDIKVSIWVDPVTGALHLVDSHVHGMLMMDMTMKTRYVAHAQAGVVPANIDIDMEVLIPFKGGKMHMVNTPTNWIVRPQ